MLKKNVTVKDQFGTEYSIQATVDKNSCSTMLHSNLRYITVDGEDIRPGFEMFFQSLNSGKIFKLIWTLLVLIGFVAQRFEMQSAPNWAKFKA